MKKDSSDAPGDGAGVAGVIAVGGELGVAIAVGEGGTEAVEVAVGEGLEAVVGEGVAEAVGVAVGEGVEGDVGEGVAEGNRFSQANGEDPWQLPAVLVPAPPTKPFCGLSQVQ